MGRYHLGALLGRGDVEVVAVSDVVETELTALAAALQAGHVAGAALDVFAHEPPAGSAGPRAMSARR